MFRPFVGEVLIGKLEASSESGLKGMALSFLFAPRGSLLILYNFMEMFHDVLLLSKFNFSFSFFFGLSLFFNFLTLFFRFYMFGDSNIFLIFG